MSRAFGILFICMIFLASHLAEAVQCCPDGDIQESITQSSSSDSHYSHAKTSEEADDHKNCDLSCHHCHHGFHFSFVTEISKITFSENIVFYFNTLQVGQFEYDLLRPPALS